MLFLGRVQPAEAAHGPGVVWKKEPEMRQGLETSSRDGGVPAFMRSAAVFACRRVSGSSGPFD